MSNPEPVGFAEHTAALYRLYQEGRLTLEEYSRAVKRLAEDQPTLPPVGQGEGSKADPLIAAWGAVAAGVLMALGSFLPWIQTPLITRNGFQLGNDLSFSMDGVIALVLGLATIAIGISRLTNAPLPRGLQKSPIVTGLAAGVLCLIDESELSGLVNKVNDTGFALVTASIGYGVLGVGDGSRHRRGRRICTSFSKKTGTHHLYLAGSLRVHGCNWAVRLVSASSPPNKEDKLPEPPASGVGILRHLVRVPRSLRPRPSGTPL